MQILIQIGLLVLGFIFLIKGADIFVSGSSALARNFNVPGLIIGLTIVALGTSAPEMAVSTVAAFQGSNEIALSNVVGSNIFNLLCVLGLCAIISPLPVDRIVLKRDFPFSIITTVFLLLISCTAVLRDGLFFNAAMDTVVTEVTRLMGFILIVLFMGYIILLIVKARKNSKDEEQGDKEPIWKCVLFIFIGLVLIISGGQAVVYSAKEIARAAGMTETLIGLTIVAVGTSLPELVTSAVAARKGETGMAIGNVIGSNIFNLLFILGVSALIHPVAVNMASVYDLIILVLISVISYLFAATSDRIARTEGIMMVMIYAADVVFAVLR
ncbi:MAG: calcium/sodium antiporter [Lachnospiraceae bacterium]|nr:calcium/sodium antiporter [Lachnospiraceae bacterium]